MQEIIQQILKGHSYELKSNTRLQIVANPSSDEPSFSLPLIIQVSNNILTVAQYTVGEWDINYDPYIEWDLDCKELILYYQWHSGLLYSRTANDSKSRTANDSKIEEKKALLRVANFTNELLERNYHLAEYAQVVHLDQQAKL